MLSLSRRLLQFGVLAFVFIVPVIQLDAGHVADLKYDRPVTRSNLPYRDNGYLAQWHDLANGGRRSVSLEGIGLGGVWTAELFGLSLSDPLAVIDATAASHTIHGLFWLSALIPVILTLALGRVFCGWICPGQLLFELGSAIRAGLEKLGLTFFDIQPPFWLKYLVLAVGISAGAAAGLTLFAWIYPPAMVTLAVNEHVVFGSASLALFGLGLIVLMEAVVSRRLWCRGLCPGGAVYSLLGTRRLLRVTRDAGDCSGCEECNDVCPYALDPMRHPPGNECDNCGKCIVACEDGSLGYRLASPLTPVATSYTRSGS